MTIYIWKYLFEAPDNLQTFTYYSPITSTVPSPNQYAHKPGVSVTDALLGEVPPGAVVSGNHT